MVNGMPQCQCNATYLLPVREISGLIPSCSVSAERALPLWQPVGPLVGPLQHNSSAAVHDMTVLGSSWELLQVPARSYYLGRLCIFRHVHCVLALFGLDAYTDTRI